MTSRDLWDLYRSCVVHDEESGFRLDASRMGVPDGWLRRMGADLDRALDAMGELELGALANPDEGRRVGHYWLRSPDLAPSREIAREISDTQERIRIFAGQVHDGIVHPPHAQRFQHVLVVGIGGSALGPQLLSDALARSSDAMAVHFLDNTDPDGIDRVLDSLGRDLSSTLTVVISKSGGTPETRNGMLETAAAYRSLGLDFAPHAVAVTGEGSDLDRTAESQGFVRRFPMWDWVGGRTSVTSAVGLVPAALQGIDVRALLAGASHMDRLTRRRDAAANPAALLALCWHHAGNGRGEKDMVILPYKDRLALFGRYLQQLVMESLGKEKDLQGNTVRQGMVVYGNKGSTDQHAYVQQLRDGPADFFATFIQVARDRGRESIEVEPSVTSGDYLHGFLLGTRQALYESGRPSLTISLPEVDPFAVGMLVALFERAVGLYASLVRVNAYHQPGVEAGKRAAAAVLDVQRKLLQALRRRAPEGGTAEDLAREAGFPHEVETAFHVLEHLAANPGRGVHRIAGPTPFEAVFSYRLS